MSPGGSLPGGDTPPPPAKGLGPTDLRVRTLQEVPPPPWALGDAAPPSGAGAVGVQPGSRPLLTKPLQLWFNLSTFPVFFSLLRKKPVPAPACLHLNLTCCLQKPLALGKAFHRPRSLGQLKILPRTLSRGITGASCAPRPPELLGRAGSRQGCWVVANTGGARGCQPLYRALK